MILIGIKGTIYDIAQTPIDSGGEGEIRRVRSEQGKVAKIYRSGVLTEELIDKLRIMIDYPPGEEAMSQIAWPLDLVADDSGNYRGFVMPELSINAVIG